MMPAETCRSLGTCLTFRFVFFHALSSALFYFSPDLLPIVTQYGVKEHAPEAGALRFIAGELRPFLTSSTRFIFLPTTTQCALIQFDYLHFYNFRKLAMYGCI